MCHSTYPSSLHLTERLQKLAAIEVLCLLVRSLTCQFFGKSSPVLLI